MSRLSALSSIWGLAFFVCMPARAQTHLFQSDTPVVRRWVLTYNPFGMGEDPSAFGAGMGYRLKNNMEIWEETSYLHGWNLTFPYAAPAGLRQILRISMVVPKWIYPDPHFFLAVEIRYRVYSYRDTSDFYHAATGDRVVDVHFLSKHYILGAAGQVGYLLPFRKDGRWSGELTAGVGVKNKKIIRGASPIFPAPSG